MMSFALKMMSFVFKMMEFCNEPDVFVFKMMSFNENLARLTITAPQLGAKGERSASTASFD